MHAWMHHPQGELAEAVHGIGFISTVDDPWPPAQPQLNRFPAMVYCSLNFFTEGAVALPGEDGELQALPDWVVAGPRTRPVASLTLAPLRTVGVVLYPDAFALLTGLAPAALQDRNDPADGLLDASWADWPQALRACADDAAQAANAGAPCADAGMRSSARACATSPPPRPNWASARARRRDNTGPASA
jgi:hypothetical protein